MYPKTVCYGRILSILSAVPFSHFRAPFGVGAQTTIPRAKFKKTKKDTLITKRPPQKKGPTNQHQATRYNLQTAKPPPRPKQGIPRSIYHLGRDIVMGVTQFPTLFSTLSQHLLALLPVLASRDS